MEPAELSELITSVNTAHAALGVADYQLTESEQGNRAFRRSLYLVRDITAGEALTAEHIKSVRPALGLPPPITIGSSASGSAATRALINR